MDSNTEIKKVITVDLGNTATSLKEYKNHIDDLRGSLLQLDETSEEYKTISQEIKNEQDKLNEVMKAGKYDVDQAEGSYNQLAKTMAELKKQWKATADEAERKELGQRILEINNQLKELDQSTGDFHRSVGDYANAFEQAFDKCLDGIQSIDGPLGEIGGMTKQLIPVIKSINATALSGLSGIKKAIASTGIGLLVVAVGTLAAYWEDISAAIKKAINSQDEYTKAVEESKKRVSDLEIQWKNINKEIEHQIRLLAAQGASSIEQTKERIRLLNDEKTSNEERIRQLKQLISAEEERKSKIIEANRAASYGATVSLGPDTRKQDELIAQYQEEIDALTKQIEGDGGINEKLLDATNTLEEQTQQQLTSISNMLKSEEQKLTDTYNTNKALLEEAGQDTTALTEKYLKDLASLNEKYSKSTTTFQKTEEQKQAEALYEQTRVNSLTELELLDEKYAKEKVQLEKFGLDTTLLTKQYESKRSEIIANEEEKILSVVKERYDNITSIYDQEAEQLSFEAEIEIENEQELADAKYKIEQDLIDKKIAALELYKEEVMLTNQDISGIEAELDALRRQYANNKMKYDKESTDYAKKQADEEKKKKQQAFEASLSVASSVFGALSDLAEENSGEAKAFAIMQTTIDTLSGAIAAYKSMAGVPYVGPALGAAAAAAVTAAGLANIAKIKSTTKESSSSSVSAPQASVPTMTSVSPLLNEQEDLNRLDAYGQNAPAQQNIRCYVVEQDISDAQNKVQVTEDNATF